MAGSWATSTTLNWTQENQPIIKQNCPYWESYLDFVSTIEDNCLTQMVVYGVCVILIVNATANISRKEHVHLKKECETECQGSCHETTHKPSIWECGAGSSIRPDNHVYSSPSVSSDDLKFIPNDNQVDDLLDPEDCQGCEPSTEWICPRNERIWIKDVKVPYGQRNRAFRTLPEEFTIMKSSIPRAGRGVWTKKDIPECVFIGPYGGEKVYNRDLSTLDYAWRIPDSDDNTLYLVDAFEPSKSNWIRYINMPLTYEEANLGSVIYNGEVYYQVLRPIPAGSELFVWYGDDYAEWLGLI